ncbi:MAG TPA: glycoside hydrolase family 13 protein, partial [Anaerolineae bacterium]|nr:glycoside hydrolase family 13 protein [Anaerolineae bacterium]
MDEAVTVEFITPEWVKDAIFYQIFPDRFASSDAVPKPNNLESWNSAPTRYGFKGGDLLGVVEHLDYLQDLGISALYLNPIFQSTANHRYHTYDYYRVDPLLGGDAAFRTLLTEAHGRGMRIVLDGVFNHASRGFFQFNHILENGAASPYLDWFTVRGWPLHAYSARQKPNYDAWWGLHALPKFNVDSPAVREFLLGVARYWIEEGVDGWRLDVPGEIKDDSFWREFRRQVKRANPDAYIVGEIWSDARHWLRGDQFDAVMNYPFTKACLSFFVGRNLDSALVSGVGYHPVHP